jgi:Tfp pilus assembly protein PilN
VNGVALHLNLLHEEILQERQRKRDPLKLGLLALIGCGALMFGYYSWNAYRTLEIRSRLGAVERNWSKLEPSVTAAQKKVTELQALTKTVRALDDYIDTRFYWAPLLDKIARCVAPNTQLTSLGGTLDESKGVTITIEGVAAGREPRAAAEDLRQMLSEQLGHDYTEVKVEFKSLEDLDTVVNLGGTHMPMARYNLAVSFKPSAQAKPSATPAQRNRRKKDSE